MGRVGPVSLLRDRDLAGNTAVAHHNRTQLSVEDAHHGAHPPLIGFGDRLQPYQQFDAGFEFDPVLLPVTQTVEELVGTQSRGIAVLVAMRLELRGRAREQQPIQSGLTLRTRGGQHSFVLGGQLLDRLGRAPAVKRLGPQRFRPAARRLSQFASQKTDHTVGDVVASRVGGEVVGIDTRADHSQRQITHHLARWGDLHQPAQHPVCGSVVRLDLLETATQAQRDGLLTQIAQLAARDFVGVDPAGRARRTGRRDIERRIDLA